MGWERIVRRVARRGVAPATAAATDELRIRLPLLWPDGPDAPVDTTALRALSQQYAYSGRTLADLLADLDELCDVVGIEVSSRLIETSSVAWSDALLHTVAAPETGAGRGPGAVNEVERRLSAHGSAAWTDVPSGHLLVVTLTVPEADGDLEAIASEVRSLFPDCVVAEQPVGGRVLAAITDSPDLPHQLRRLAAFGAEHLAATPTITTRAVPADLVGARRDLRATG